ncbi:MAG: 3-deoxy-8-phosphooctulonate synthase [Candidatus Schekmanbacteria bacterium RBG_13_48_7]|uniref:2-dehydro-3-deoxyphosphooctonate aldolase n=1 Tax=Candidatus Schekmanbacteria bacterium RBG_13_48_7 TaxID=1817878 RepID=A0A1F7RXL0_9BACT|nr:MAG: 3-deoxy-8-phosphooctulonate synthase [Candidatus Schekmanbacteria bacterium RBG_13_48_7]
MISKKVINIGSIKIGGRNPVVLVGGPCVIESESHAVFMAQQIQQLCSELHVPFIFKSSYDKANRTSINSYRGPGLSKGLEILQTVKDKVGVPVLSDVHSITQVKVAQNVLDILQIPAFLCRQTDLLLAAGETGKIINVKKGQFLSPEEMFHVVIKIESTGNDQIILTERGSSFGYNNLVVDFRSFVILKKSGYPIMFDGTHSVQKPAASGNVSGGDREFVPALCRAAVATGCDVLFLEIHDNPDKALCDGPNMVNLEQVKTILGQLKIIERSLWNIHS